MRSFVDDTQRLLILYITIYKGYENINLVPHPHGEMNRLTCNDLFNRHNIVTNG